MDPHGDLQFQQPVDEHQRRGLANVVGAGLERQPPDGDGLTGELSLEVTFDLFGEHGLLPLVDGMDGLEHARLDAVGPCQRGQGTDVLGKTATSVTHAGEKKGETDAAVVADAAADLVDVGPGALAEVRHLVDEADLRRKHGVGHVLGHLGALGRHDQQRLVGPQIRLIEVRQHVDHLPASGADDHPVGLHEVVDGHPFLEKLGVADHVHLTAGEFS